MKSILKVFFLLVAVFSTSFLLNLHFQWITVDTVRTTMDTLRASPNALFWITLLVIVILSIDSVLAVPTITTIVLAGYFLGPVQGGLAASVGVLAAGCICFFGTRYGGARFLRMIVSETDAERLGRWFESSGGFALLLSRSLPMLPEVLSCLAGMSPMKASRYLLLFALANVPFAFLAAFAGSRSSLEKPWPALLVGMGVPALGYLAWFLRRKFYASERSGAPTVYRSTERSLELRLEISGIDTRRPGSLRVFIFGEVGFPKDHAAALESHVLNIEAEKTVHTLRTDLCGEVSIKIVHDEIGDGVVRKRFGFIPDFGIGYSREAKITYRVPRFAEAAVRLDPEVETLRLPIRMQYLFARKSAAVGASTRFARAGS